ncbi:MAG: esterase-like activity of phytase family protein [Tepidisphaeraceae bacterium]
MGRVGVRTFVTGSLLLCCATRVSSAALSITDVGKVALPANGTGAAELSGITWAGGTQYYAVADGGAGLFPVSISINSATGAITSAALSAKVQLATGVDLEGVVYNASTNTVHVSDETGPAIREYNVSNGAVVSTVTVPAVYNSIVNNFSLESLSRGGSNLWTANEEALTVDGPLSTTGAGSWVRLQRFNVAMAPTGQWAYRTDAISADSPFTTAERSGVSDLLALPDGRLLVLERELGGPVIPDFRNRIYLVDFTGATDSSAIASLSSTSFTGVTKTLLWEGGFANDNFEGITLGPQLANGDYSVLLVLRRH